MGFDFSKSSGPYGPDGGSRHTRDAMALRRANAKEIGRLEERAKWEARMGLVLQELDEYPASVLQEAMDELTGRKEKG